MMRRRTICEMWDSVGKSLYWNRIILLVSSGCFMLIGLIVIGVYGSEMRSSVLVNIFQPHLNSLLGGSIALACFIFICGIIGLVGGQRRSPTVIKVFFLSTLCIIVAEVFCAVLLMEAGSPNQMQAQNSELLSGWLTSVDIVVNQKSNYAAVQAYLESIMTGGDCCGYDSTSDTLQNPAVFKCTSTTVCKPYMMTDLGSQINSLASTQLSTLAAEGVLLLFLAVLLISIVPKPYYQEYTGAYYYA